MSTHEEEQADLHQLALELGAQPPSEPEYQYLSISDLERCNGKTLVLDTETTGLHWWKDTVIGIGIHCPAVGISGYLPTLNLHEFDEAVWVMKNSWQAGTTVICHNLKFDFHFLGIDPSHVPWKIMDTTVLVHLMDPRNIKKLEVASQKYLGASKKATFVYKIKGKAAKVWQWPTKLVAEYCTNDCVQTYELAKLLYPKICEAGMKTLFWKQMEYLGRVWEVERNGMRIDPVFIEKAQRALEANVRSMEAELADKTGQTFNWRSATQLSNAIFAGMGIPMPHNPFGATVKFKTHFTKTCTSTFILMERAHHPLGELIMTLRETSKLINNLKRWLLLADSNYYVHTNFNLTGTRTGRLSSSQPNTQNMPGKFRTRETQSVYSGAGGDSRTEEYNLRVSFIPRPGMCYFSIDYKQMEIRVFGVQSGDENMLAALREGTDVHAMIARKVWGTGDPVHREWAKTLSFGLLYGLSSGSLEFRLGVTTQESKAITDSYWQAFPRIKPFMTELINRCKQRGYVTYWSGRRWYEEVELFMFKAVNAMVQGGSHDMFMVAACRIAKFLEEKYPVVKMVNLVHDEFDFEMPEELAAEVMPQIAEIMSVPDLFGMAFPTDAKYGYNYGELHDWPPKPEAPKVEVPVPTLAELAKVSEADEESEEGEEEPVLDETRMAQDFIAGVLNGQILPNQMPLEPLPVASLPYSIYLPEERK